MYFTYSIGKYSILERRKIQEGTGSPQLTTICLATRFLNPYAHLFLLLFLPLIPTRHSAGIGIGFYGNSETNDGVYQVTYSLLSANHTLSSIDSLVSETVALISATVRGELTQLEETLSQRTELVAVVRNTRRQAEAVAQTLDGIPFWKDARGGANSSLWMTVMSFLVLILSWGSMGLETAAAVGLSDFCFEPDGYVMNTTQARTGLSPGRTGSRLTVCQRALSNIHSQLYGLEREAIPHFPAAEKNIVSIQSTLNITESNFHHLVALLNCRGLHKVPHNYSYLSFNCSIHSSWARIENNGSPDPDHDV
uniref:Protein tweety homolog n=1 Tax=Pseudonaja textilis TaxID=8673 RepID=A0A670Z436_PSETE